MDSWRINLVRHLQLHEHACIYYTHMQASIAHICLHRLHTHASHITAVVPQRVYRHGLQIETHTRVHAHPESSHACTPSVIACMYTQCHRVHVHPVSSHACTPSVIACMYTQCHCVDHAVARQCRRVPVLPSIVSCCISTNLLIDRYT